MKSIKQILILLIFIALSSCGDVRNPVEPKPNAVLKTESKYLLDPKNDSRIALVTQKDYDKSAKLILTVNYNNGVISTKSAFSYQGTESQEVKYNYGVGGAELSRETNKFTYTPDGKLLSYISMDSSGSMLSKAEYAYDNQGNIVRAIEVTGNTTTERNYTYVYNQAGNLSERIIYVNKDVIAQRDSLVYFNGQPSFDKYTLSANGTVLNRIKYSFRLDGKLQFETEYDKSGAIIRKYGYEYIYY